jgi:hypothetical protein
MKELALLLVICHNCVVTHEIKGSNCNGYQDNGLLWCDAVQSGRWVPTFWYEPGASIFRLKWILKTEKVGSSKMLVPIYSTTLCCCHTSADSKQVSVC